MGQGIPWLGSVEKQKGNWIRIGRTAWAIRRAAFGLVVPVSASAEFLGAPPR
jgi:hypothetical protein